MIEDYRPIGNTFQYGLGRVSLTQLNDQGFPFEAIAALIRLEPAGMFVEGK